MRCFVPLSPPPLKIPFRPEHVHIAVPGTVPAHQARNIPAIAADEFGENLVVGQVFVVVDVFQPIVTIEIFDCVDVHHGSLLMLQ